MSVETEKLRAELLAIAAERGGVVMVNGRKMIKAEIARSVLRDFAASMCAEVLDRLSGAISGDRAAQQRVAAEIKESERRLETVIAEIMPISN